MILSRRERYIAYGTAGAVLLLAADYFIVSPLLARRAELNAEAGLAEVELARAAGVITNDVRLSRKWTEMTDKGLRSDAPSAETQTLGALRRWAQDSRVNLSSLKPERSERHDKQFQRITFRATANGTMQSISEFLWRVQTAEVPIRVTDFQITGRKEGTDDLKLELGVATIYLSPEPEPRQPGRSAGAVAAREAL